MKADYIGRVFGHQFILFFLGTKFLFSNLLFGNVNFISPPVNRLVFFIEN